MWCNQQSSKLKNMLFNSKRLSAKKSTSKVDSSKLIADSSYWIGVALLVFGNIGFSLKAITIKLMYRYQIDSVSVLGLRMLFSLPFFLAVILYLRRNKNYIPLSYNDIFRISGLGILCYYASSMLDFLGLQFVSAGVERLVLFTYPTIVLLISALFLHKKIKRYQVFALVITYIGVVIAFVAERGLGEQKNFLLGTILVFACAMTYAIYVVCTGEMVQRIGSARFTSIALIGATVPSLIHNYFANGMNLFHFAPEVYKLTVWLVVVSTVIPVFLIVEGIRRVGSNVSGLIGFIGPISTIFFADIFLGEHATFLQIIGTIIVIYGIFNVTRKAEKN